MVDSRTDAQLPATRLQLAQSEVDAYLGKYFPFRPEVGSFRLHFHCLGGNAINIPNEQSQAKRSSVILAVAHSLKEMRARHRGERGCWTINSFCRGPLKKEELLGYLLEEGGDKFIVMTVVLFRELRAELESLIGEAETAKIVRWGCLDIDVIE